MTRSNGPTIRPLALADSDLLQAAAGLLDELANWHAGIEPEHYGRAGSRPLAFHRHRLETLLREPRRGAAFVAMEAQAADPEPPATSTPLGLILVHFQAPERPAPSATSRPVAVISDLVVTSARRRNGLGRALVRAAQAWAEEAGADRVVLNVRESNREALQFYDRLGYRTVSRWLAVPLTSGS